MPSQPELDFARLQQDVYQRLGIETRFWTKVDRSAGPEACWPWRGYIRTDGYGQFALTHRRPARAHRISWELAHGEIKNGLWVLHRCDNPPCVNPDHLFLGTHADNEADKVNKGRQARGPSNGMVLHPDRRPRGSKHGRAKLTDEQVLEIRESWERRSCTQSALAAKFGVSISTISLIIKRRRWNASG